LKVLLEQQNDTIRIAHALVFFSFFKSIPIFLLSQFLSLSFEVLQPWFLFSLAFTFLRSSTTSVNPFRGRASTKREGEFLAFTQQLTNDIRA
jgi:hypothetical protein